MWTDDIIEFYYICETTSVRDCSERCVCTDTCNMLRLTTIMIYAEGEI